MNTLENLERKDDTTSILDMTHLGKLEDSQMKSLADAIIKHQTITEVLLKELEISDKGAKEMARVIAENPRIEKMDLGYNNIKGPGMEALAAALAGNKTITEMKLHRQKDDMGPKAEQEVVKLWETNITMTRLYITLHQRNCNNANTKAEVRNKDIARCISRGESYRHLDPATQEEWTKEQAEKKKLAKEEEAKKNAPITEKVESTGGPYTYKQLTCAAKFRPDDVLADSKNRHTYLSDDEFLEVFKMSKEDFGKLAGWKQNGAKKTAKLH